MKKIISLVLILLMFTSYGIKTLASVDNTNRIPEPSSGPYVECNGENGICHSDSKCLTDNFETGLCVQRDNICTCEKITIESSKPEPPSQQDCELSEAPTCGGMCDDSTQVCRQLDSDMACHCLEPTITETTTTNSADNTAAANCSSYTSSYDCVNIGTNCKWCGAVNGNPICVHLSNDCPPPARLNDPADDTVDNTAPTTTDSADNTAAASCSSYTASYDCVNIGTNCKWCGAVNGNPICVHLSNDCPPPAR